MSAERHNAISKPTEENSFVYETKMQNKTEQATSNCDNTIAHYK